MADEPLPGAKAWMVKAWRDLEVARRAAEGEPPFYDAAVYHCQQAAEKAVKAFLVEHGKEYEKTHDIALLVNLAVQVEPGFKQMAGAAAVLTPFATRFRYPNSTFAVEPEADEYKEAQQHAQAVYDFVLNLLPESERP